MMKQRIISILKNKYFIAFVAVLIWLLFFERHGFIQQWRVNRDIRDLKRNKAFYKEEILKDSMVIEELKGDTDAIERLAREKYFMKKEGEDIFIIEENMD